MLFRRYHFQFFSTLEHTTTHWSQRFFCLGLHGSVALDEVLWPIRPLPSVPLTDATHFYVLWWTEPLHGICAALFATNGFSRTARRKIYWPRGKLMDRMARPVQDFYEKKTKYVSTHLNALE